MKAKGRDMGASARGSGGHRDLEEHSVLQGRAWRLEEHRNTKYMGASARQGRHRDTQCSASQGTLYRNTREQGFFKRVGHGGTQDPLFRNTRRTRDMGRGERQRGSWTSVRARHLGTQGPLQEGRRWTRGLRKERTQSC